MTGAYPPIADYGFIGDLHTAALISVGGSVDWLCLPHFDSPSVFAALLDRKNGGHWTIAPSVPFTSTQRYLPATNVLVTEFNAEGGGVVQLVDFMPVGPSRRRHSQLLRNLRGVRGVVPMTVHWEPRFNYGRNQAAMRLRRHGVLATDRDDDVATLTGPPEVVWQVRDGAAIADIAPAEGHDLWFVHDFDDDDVHPIVNHDCPARLDATVKYWDAWTSTIRYKGAYRKEVERSALALKLCCYEPTGAIVAAPTTSLPESLAGGRNWDYRYVWIRDSAFVLDALETLGLSDETGAFLQFLKRVCRKEEDAPLQIMYGIDGRRELREEILEHLEGYAGAGPVRIGNGAAGQFQLDIYGEIVATAWAYATRHPISEGVWKAVKDLVDRTAAQWRLPDFSIWEPRYDPQHHVFSKVMSWVALDRGARLARFHGTREDAQRWRAEARAVREEVLAKGWDPERQTFVQCYGASQLDAALLIMPKVRFLRRNDPRIVTTIAAIRRELGSSVEELVYRYKSHDGLVGEEGAFIICSFWMIQCLALSGAVVEAERLFRNLVRRANHVGLMAEEIDPGTGMQLGNFPQGLSHAALINTACLLERLRPKGV